MLKTFSALTAILVGLTGIQAPAHAVDVDTDCNRHGLLLTFTSGLMISLGRSKDYVVHKPGQPSQYGSWNRINSQELRLEPTVNNRLPWILPVPVWACHHTRY